MLKYSSFYIHIARSLKISNIAAVEFISATELSADSSHFIPLCYELKQSLGRNQREAFQPLELLQQKLKTCDLSYHRIIFE
jgi:hypothetical protein